MTIAKASRSRRENLSRIQKEKRKFILEAALDAFSSVGFRGTTIDKIAELACLSKPNIFYYYKNKEEIYQELFNNLFDLWLSPLRSLDVRGDPVEEILGYVRLKLAMSQDYPKESRLFANEIIRGCPRIAPFISGELKRAVDDAVTKIQTWVDNKQISPVDPKHLIFSIWAVTQHYADFESQILLLDEEHSDMQDIFPKAEVYVEQLFEAVLTKKQRC